MATAKVVQAHDEKLPGIDGLPGADTGVPPARFGVCSVMVSGRVMVTGKRVTDEDCVGPFGIEAAVSLVNQLESRQGLSALQGKWGIPAELLRLDHTH